MGGTSSSRKKISSVKTSKKEIKGLPVEIKLLILSHLTPQEICKSVAPVCKHWYVLSRDPSLWLNLHLNLSSWKSTAQIESRCTHLNKLVLDGFHTKTFYKLFSLPFDCPKLKVLDLRFVEVSDIFLIVCSFRSPLIESLTLKSCKFDIPPGIWFYGLSRLRNLKHLRLHTTSCSVTQVDVIVKTCLKLQTLILGSTIVTNENLQNLVLNLKDNLQVLSVIVTQVTAEGFAALASCVHLQVVTFHCAACIDDTVLDALAHLPLKELSVYAANLPDVQSVIAVSTECFDRFFSNPERKHLKKMVFEGFPIFDDSALLSGAYNCPQLVDLTISTV